MVDTIHFHFQYYCPLTRTKNAIDGLDVRLGNTLVFSAMKISCYCIAGNFRGGAKFRYFRGPVSGTKFKTLYTCVLCLNIRYSCHEI